MIKKVVFKLLFIMVINNMDNESLKRKRLGFYNYVKIKDLRNKDIVNATLLDKSNVSNYMNGRVKPSENFITTFEKIYNVNLEDYENTRINTTKDHVLNDLTRIKQNRKGVNSNEGRIINDNDLVPATQYIVPIKGQAGLKKAFFYPDEYIEEHFDKELILVRPTERAVYHKIEVDGNSMPGTLEPGDWARCEDISKIFWTEKDTFKPNKIYCLIHRKLGILFKRISKTYHGTITLSSDNPNKIDYPDQDFDLMEFSKILIVRKVEKDV